MSAPGVQSRDESEAPALLLKDANAGVRARVAWLLLNRLSRSCARYCLLSGYDALPDGFETDIDFMVPAADLWRIAKVIDDIANASGTVLFQAIQHEISACAFVLAAEEEQSLKVLQLDSCSDYRHFGRLWLRADEVLETRRWHSHGFWIPAARYEFTYYLIKRVNKCDFRDAHGARLSRLYGEDVRGCDELLRRFWNAKSSAAIAKMAAAEDWEPLAHNVKRYRNELRRAFTAGMGSQIVSSIQSARHSWERARKPTGAWIAFIGPDGCGKSAVIDAVASEFTPAFQKIEKYHLRPKALPASMGGDVPVTDPHGKAARGWLLSTMKLLYLFADYWIGYPQSIWAATLRTRLLLFDRYFYDVVVDPRRVRYGGPRWLPGFLMRLLPRPEKVILLNAPPNVLWSRKQEVSYDEVVRQQQEFLRIADAIPRAIVLDAARPIDEVVRLTRRAVIDHLSRRTRTRLGLMARSDEKKLISDAVQPEVDGVGLSAILSGRVSDDGPESYKVRIISKNGSAKWILPEDAQRALPVLKSWRPYGAFSRTKWNVIKFACNMGAVSRLPGINSELVQCNLAYWRERIPEFSDSWHITAYIGNPSPTRKALLFFISPRDRVEFVAKVPIHAAARKAILNEARVLAALANVVPVPHVLACDEELGISLQSWIEGTSAPRRFGREHLEILKSFASEGKRVRLSDHSAELTERTASVVPSIDSSLLRDALSMLKQEHEMKACIEHGDFTPWNIRRLADGRLALIDWEWAHAEGFPWQDVCRYFYMQDYLFHSSKNMWQRLMGNPLLSEYRGYYGLSSEVTHGLTVLYLLTFLCNEQADKRRVEYAKQRIRELMS